MQAVKGKKYKAYEEYKDSGIEWLGEVPKAWSVKKLSYCFKQIGSGTTPNSNNEEYYGGEIPWVITGDLNDKEIITSSKTITRKALDDYSSLKIYSTDSLIIAMYGATIGKLGILKIPAATNQACCVLTSANNCHIKFMFYWFLGNRKHIIALSYGGSQPNISQEVIKSLKIVAPQLKEQQKIATFLDRETSKLDNLIEKKKRLIELLKEKRQAIISQAVTKGLDPNVPMKDSGIEWFGEIPEHWDLKPLKFVIKTIGGSTPSKDIVEYWNGDIPWVSPKDMKEDHILKTEDCITELAVKNSNIEIIPKRSVIVVVRSGILRHSFPVAINDIEVTINQDMKALIPHTKFLSQEYLFFLLKGLTKPILHCCKKVGATVDSIESELLEHFVLSLPPDNEQKKLVLILTRRTTQIESLIKKLNQQITKIKEYRQALISAAVTGKIDVRDEV